MASQLKRIEYLEEVFRRSSLSRQSPNCICFPEQQPPCFLYAPVYGIAAAVLCTIHGYRFRYPLSTPIFIPEWRREVEVGMHWPKAAERYRKAWNASFPPGSWPVEEIEVKGRKWLLPRSETGKPRGLRCGPKSSSLEAGQNLHVGRHALTLMISTNH